jgi:hypothetical protein
MYAADFDPPLTDEIQKGLEITQHTARRIFANRLRLKNPLMFR